MATLDEIFAAMPDEASVETHEALVIDPDTRQIAVPDSEAIFGVEADTSAEKKYFACPRIVGTGVDLAACFLRVNFRNANGEVDAYLVEDLAVSGDLVTFSWKLSKKVTQYKGLVQFIVCACYPGSDGTISTEWNTTLASGRVLEGLEPDASMVEAASSDAIAQLLALVDKQSAAVAAEGTKQIAAVQAATNAATAAAKEQIEAKGAATLATIPEDYTTLAGKVNGLANAIKGKATGEIVRVDDVSPVEHTMAVKVRGKNLIPYPYAQTAYTGNGGTFTAQADGGVMASGTPTDYVSLNLYKGAPLAKSGKIVFSASGDYENVTISMVIYDAADGVLFSKEAWKGVSPISVNLDDYPQAASWLVFVKRSVPNVEMTGTIYPQLELGDAATAYAPYVAPESVKVTRCGKNLTCCTSNYVSTNQGVTITRQLNMASALIDGTAAADFSTEIASNVFLPAGTYTLSVLGLNEIDANHDRLFVKDAETGAVVVNSIICSNPKTFTLESGKTVNVSVVIKEGSAYTGKTFYFQLEAGDTATDYEPYIGEEYIPEADGTVPGVTSLAPTTSLLTDTPGVTVELEYNRDTNLVIADILEKIAALGGTT